MLAADRSHAHPSPRKLRRQTIVSNNPPASTSSSSTKSFNSTAFLIEKCEELKVNVYGTINSNYRDFLNTSDYVLDLRDEIASIAEKVEQAKAQAEDGDKSFLTKLHLSSRSIKTLEQDLQALGILARLHYELQNFDHLVNIGEFVGAAATVAEMSLLVETLQELPNCDKSVFNVVKSQTLIRRATLRHRLNDLFHSIFSFSHGIDGVNKLTVSQRIPMTAGKEYFDNPPTIEDLFAALATADMLQEKLQWLGQQLIPTFIVNVIKQPTAQVTQIKNKLHSQLLFAGGKKVTTAGNLKSHLSTALEKIIFVCQFMLENGLPTGAPLGDDPPSYAKSFGETWAESLCRALLENALMPLIPDDKASLERFSELSESVRGFDAQLKELELIPPNREDLVTFISNLHHHYTLKRRNELLRVARDILLSDDTNTYLVTEGTERGGVAFLTKGTKEGKSAEGPSDKRENGKFMGGKDGVEVNDSSIKLPAMHISVQAQMLMELVYQTLLEAEKTEDQQSAIELFFCARDLVDLYRAITPQHLADVIESSITRAMIFYCDCEYIVHHLITLGYQFATKLPPPVKSYGTFVDLVPSFRKLGEYYFRNQLRHQRDVILNQLGLLTSLEDLSNEAKFKNIETHIKFLVNHLTGIAKSWKAVLPKEMALQAVGLLLDTTLTSLIEKLRAITTLNMEDSYQLKYILSIVRRLEECFYVTKLDAKRKVIEKAPIPKYAKTWELFISIVDALVRQDPVAFVSFVSGLKDVRT
ncbi:hypothetical protein SeMB42_g04632 [Synchytrium endobioticum]|uniref:Uncharacterized protein n=1 Tax=Synchytrium endobioticum TaxID=286115 RepID=A0A507CXS2_9FUNG|nr:hypothetical protein SeMB42_g04632 [Synchytrium endobioticum]